MSPLKIASALAVSAALVASVVHAGGHGGKPPGVAARQAHMQLNGHNVGILFGMVQGKAEYDADAAAAAAANLAMLARLKQNSYWTPGTDTESIEGTRALPALWAADSTAREIGGELAEATEALAAVAGDGLEPMKESVVAVGKVCTACHEKYQQPRN